MHLLHKPKNSKLYFLYFIPELSWKLLKYLESLVFFISLTCSQLLQIEKGDKILEIGTGSGYQAAVLCEMGVKLYTIERIRELYRKTSTFLPSINYYPKKMIYGDGYQGYLDESPYDGIIVTAGATEVPKNLLSQLKLNGKMVIPLGDEVQKMLLYTKISDEDYDIKDFGDFQFVPMLKDKI